MLLRCSWPGSQQCPRAKASINCQVVLSARSNSVACAGRLHARADARLLCERLADCRLCCSSQMVSVAAQEKVLLNGSQDGAHAVSCTCPLIHGRMQRDVPGFTRSAVPILADEGVRAVTIGVNGGSAPPGVPKNSPFIWRDEASGAELFTVLHPGECPVHQPVERHLQEDGSICVLVLAFTGSRRHPLDNADRAFACVQGAAVNMCALCGPHRQVYSSLHRRIAA